MRVQIAVAAAAILIGLSFMNSRRHLCRHGCWIDGFFDWILPSQFEFLAGGLPWVIVGVALIAQTIHSHRR